MTRPWQQELAETVSARLGSRAEVAVAGSTLDPATLDGWSDLDLQLRLAGDVDLADLVDPAGVWAHDLASTLDEQVVRLVLRDGRRLDLQVRGNGRCASRPPTSRPRPGSSRRWSR